MIATLTPEIRPAVLEQAHQAQQSSLRIRTICAWCQKHLSGPEHGPAVVSHGICPACKAAALEGLR